MLHSSHHQILTTLIDSISLLKLISILAMDRQRSFSVKPIKFLVFTFTISFSVIFLIFFSTWVSLKPIPSPHLDTHSFRFNLTSITLQSLRGSNESSSQNVIKNSILMGTHFRGDEVASEIGNGSTFGGAQKEESEITVDSLLSGNLSLTSLAKNLSVNSGNIASYSSDSIIDSSNELGISTTGDNSMNSESADEETEEVNDVIEGNFTSGSFERQHVSSRISIEEKNKVVCDITKGKWVFDESYPLYRNVDCPFIDEGFSCEANGRLDKDYVKWRWQPQDCDIPRFNATNMLELIRGKRLVFVGDSINRNQWESMLCLLMGGVHDPKKVYETRHRKITKEKGDYSFKFEDYKCTVEYYVTHFIVHESKARLGKKRVQTLRIDAIDKGSSRWKGADILVFNTAHWWNHYKTKAGINYYQEGNQVHPQLDVTEAFKRALLTWASWVDKYINPRKTRIFFRSSAPSHFSGGVWNNGGHCKEAFRPINETFASNYPEKNLIVEEIIGQMKNPVTFLNITHLSDYRPDGHPSIYGKKPAPGNRGVQDCSHWCLPGVPDNWNELLYYYLQLGRDDKSQL